MNLSSSVTYGMLIHSTVNALAFTRCGNNPCFLRIDAFVRCVKPTVCSRSTLSQSWHRLTVLNHDSHHWSPGRASDGFVVAGLAGDSHSSDDSSSRSNSHAAATAAASQRDKCMSHLV